MWSALDLVGHGGLVVAGLLVVAAVFAVFYVPAPANHYVAAILLLAAVASQIYAEGYRNASGEWKAKYDAKLAAINSENEQAVIAAQQTEKDLAKAQADAINAQVDMLAAARQGDQAEITRLQALIANDKTAGDKLNEGIKTVIRGNKARAK